MSKSNTSLKLTILGCGSSGGVPRPGSGWGECDPANPKNRRRRCSLLVEQIGPKGKTSVLIDTSPDLREQLLAADIRHLDAILYTHDHADHTHGIDDLRPLVLHMRKVIDVHADDATAATLMSRFSYIFATPEGSDYPPIARLNPMLHHHPLVIDGAGGPIAFLPIPVEHGANFTALGIRIGKAAYVPDVSHLDEVAMAALSGLDLIILDALRYKPHPTHFSVAESLAMIETLNPKHAVLTNLHTDIDYLNLSNGLPRNIEPAYDGLSKTILI